MRLAFAMLLFFVLVGAASAQSLPALYSVTDVASDDRLNIRAGPGTGSRVIGDLAPDAAGVEVTALSESGRWGRINASEGIGWVSMRYLSQEHQESWREGEQPVRCFGTEPFWSMPIFLPTHRIEFHDPSEGGFELVGDAGALPTTDFPPTLAVPFSGYREGMVVIREVAACSDQMSERLYGLEGQVYWRGNTGALSGCCTLGD